MANVFLTPQAIAKQALASLYETTVMLPLVYTDVSSDFATQKIGNTVNIRKPAVFVANDFDRATGIVPQDATEGMVPVILNKIADVSFNVTSEDLTLSIEKFDEQLLSPAMEAISQKIDRAILALRSDITQSVGVIGTDGIRTHTYDTPEALIDAGVVLNLAKVGALGRNAVIGPVANGRWLDSPVLKNAQASGSTDALREAYVGRRLSGFDPYWSQNIGQPKAVGAQVSGDPTTEIGVAFHNTAFAFASAPLEVAPGSQASVVSYKGISIRIAYQYDIKYKQTIVSLDTLYGVKTLDATRAVLIKGINKA
ncbi:MULTISPECIES: P22 phage major capsid protein family protein [unclassified Cryobacterium]|uniref:P22 phage major capsid protein family protein n=1 Tax=unclassified Cryobacterium TaxID=2649013 RepID=UPI002AB50BC5|nr:MULTISPECIES: P22 phage major capsid protein family protein [unclassified Cryobacterium]MDY7542610.1 P22 phage major capsid protein family protein [Cryobacterium sp. 5B3]MEB0264730.1 P22 phage major capsid protein family protein [Cryobacterium sp. 10I5]MEB0273702.1 P22 phage major capsid protein family protein [Cryobacterium sp. 5B3]